MRLARHAVSDWDWSRVKGLLPARDGKPEWVSARNRLFFDAVLWVSRTGVPWRDLPVRFGHGHSVWRRFDRWARKGVWLAVFEVLPDPDVEWLILDSTVIRAPPFPVRQERTKADGTGGQADPVLGRSRGGFGTQIHAAVFSDRA